MHLDVFPSQSRTEESHCLDKSPILCPFIPLSLVLGPWKSLILLPPPQFRLLHNVLSLKYVTSQDAFFYSAPCIETLFHVLPGVGSSSIFIVVQLSIVCWYMVHLFIHLLKGILSASEFCHCRHSHEDSDVDFSS